MTKLNYTLFLLIFSFIQGSAQTKVVGTVFPNTMKAGTTNLILNGAGLREKYFLDLYVGGLYLQEKDKDAARIMNANEPMAFRITIVSSMITSEKMKDAVLDGFEKSTGGNTKPIQPKINAFISAFEEKLNIGDTFEMIYWNEKMQVLKNGKLKVTIDGMEFKKAALGIWLSDNPVDSGLKDDLLGR